MAFDENLANRIEKILSRKRDVTQKKMFGGLAFMLKDKMFCGVTKDQLMARIGPDQAELKKSHVTPMDFTGRPPRGYVYVASAGINTEAKLRRWIDLCITFVRDIPANKKAASSQTNYTFRTTAPAAPEGSASSCSNTNILDYCDHIRRLKC